MSVAWGTTAKMESTAHTRTMLYLWLGVLVLEIVTGIAWRVL